MASSWLSLTLRNVLRNRRRGLLTVASLSVSICLVGVLFAVARALFYGADATPGQAQRLVVHHKIALTQDLPAAHGRVIKNLPGVRAATMLRWFGGTYKDARDPKNRFMQFAIEPQTLFDVYPEYRISAPEEQGFLTQKSGCVASRTLVETLGWKPGERITLKGSLLAQATLELTLVGVFDTPTRNAVLYFNVEYLRDSLRPGDPLRDTVQQFYVQADSTAGVADLTRRIDAAFAESSFPTKAEPEQAFLLSFASFLGNLKVFLIALSAAVTFTMFLVATTMLSMSVRERTREVGILKTVGFSSGEVLAMVVGEATIIASAGGVIGAALASGVCAALATAAMANSPGYVIPVLAGFKVSPMVLMLTLSLAVGIGLASSIGPGWFATRMSILDALHDNG
jgi:putative ABC transport system permease protein